MLFYITDYLQELFLPVLICGRLFFLFSCIVVIRDWLFLLFRCLTVICPLNHCPIHSVRIFTGIIECSRTLFILWKLSLRQQVLPLCTRLLNAHTILWVDFLNLYCRGAASCRRVIFVACSELRRGQVRRLLLDIVIWLGISSLLCPSFLGLVLLLLRLTNLPSLINLPFMNSLL